MSDLTAIKSNPTLKPFFDNNSSFDLRTFNFFDKDTVKKLKWTNLDQKETIDRLKACQRLLRLGVDASEAIALCASKLDSALAIASLSETAFVEEAKKANFSDPGKAKAVYRLAREKTAGLMVFLANAIQFSSPRQATALFDNAQSIRNSLGDIPSYQDLFGSLDYLQCEHCQSIFSPSAYFVDLMRMVEEYIVETDNNRSLKGRRPDLENILLTCDNTNDTVPYTEIVSEVLETKLKQKLGGKDVFQHLATAEYPRNLPFNLYLEQIRIYIANFKTNLADIYQAFHPQAPERTPWAREYLGLSPEEYQLIITKNVQPGSLSDRYGVTVVSDSKLGGLNKKETFLKQTNLSWQELDDLLKQNLSKAEIKSNVPHQFFINQHFSDTKKYLKLNDKGDEIENLNLIALDRIDRFLRLAKKLDWDFADLDWVLASISSNGTKKIDETAIQKIAKIKRLQVQTKLPLDVLCSFWHDMKTIGKGDKPKRPQDLFDRIFNNLFTSQGQEVFQPTEKWTIDGTDEKNSLLQKRLQAALKLKDKDFNVLVRGIFLKVPSITLNLANLSILFRHAQMLHLLGLKAEEYKLLLKFLGKSFASLEQLEGEWPMDQGSDTTLQDKAGSNNGTFHGQANWQTVTDFPQAATRKVLVFNGTDNFIDFSKTQYLGSEYTISGWFKSSSKSQQTIFAATQSNGHNLSIELQSDGKLSYLHRVPPGSSGGKKIDSQKSYADGKWHHFAAVKDPRQMRLYVDAELVGTEEENQSISANTTIFIGKLPDNNDAHFFNGQIAGVRIWKIALPAVPQFDIGEIIAIADLAKWLKVSRFTVWELDYILDGTESTSVKVRLPEKRMESLMKDLWQNVKLPPGNLSDRQRNELNDTIASHFDIEAKFFSILAQKFAAESLGAEDYIKRLLTEVKRVTDAWNKSMESFFAQKKLRSRQDLLSIFAQKLGAESVEADELFWLLAERFNPQLTQAEGALEPQLVGQPLEPAENQIKSQLTEVKRVTDAWNKIMESLIEDLGQNDRLPVGKLTDKQRNELNETIASNFGIEPKLFSILAKIGAQSVGSQDYITLLLTKVKTGTDAWNKIVGCLKYISQWYLLVFKLPLTDRELTSITKHRQAYNIHSLTQLKVGEIQTLYRFKHKLVSSFNKPKNGVVEYLEAPAIDKLAKLTGWNQEQIQEVIKYFQPGAGEKLDGSVADLLKLKGCFDLSLALGSRVHLLCSLCDLLKDKAANADWDTYKNQANSLANLAQAKYSDKEWTEVFAKLNGAVAERKCQVLSEFALLKLNMKNLRQLSEYLLLDVEMTSCACNSPIQLAILSVQTYLQRCKMGIEPGVTQVKIPPVWWEWIMNYRLWEANRKVFLYPENYIDPSLRRDASPIFKELQDELLQSEITADAVEAAYHNYFDKLAELAKLQIVDSGRFLVPTPESPEPVETLFILAKTLTQPHTFYYRTCERPADKKPLWGYWQKIDLQINSDYLAPVYAFNRLFVFWVETKEIKKPQGNGNKTVEITQATIKYSFLNVGQKWVAPQNLVTDVEIPSAKVDDPSLGKDFWQQVYPLLHQMEAPTLSSSEKEITVLWGGLSATLSSHFNQQIALFIRNRRSVRNIASDLLYSPPINVKKETFSQANILLTTTITVGNFAILSGVSDLKKDLVAGAVFEYQNETLVRRKELDIQLKDGPILSGATTVGNLAIFAGSNNKVYVFEAQKGTLVRREDLNLTLSDARSFLAATTVGNFAIFAGGDTNDQDSNVVDVFEVKNGTLVRREDLNLRLSHARSFLAATTVGNFAIFAGGDTNDQDSNVVDVFEVKNGTLVKREDLNLTLSHARSRLAATTVGNLAIFAGGSDGNKCSDIVDVFEVKNGKLEQKKISDLKLSHPRRLLAATTVGNLAIFAGGSDDKKKDLDAVDVFEDEGGILLRKELNLKLSEARSGLTATTVGNIAIFSGGLASDAVDAFYIFNPDPALSSLPSSPELPTNTTVTPIKNQSNAFTLQNRSEAFSALSKADKLAPVARLTTSAIRHFNHTLLAEGLDGLLSLESQKISEESSFPPAFNRNVKLDFDGAYGAYFWEIFFHIPFLIASTLNAHQRYNEARKWYQYIFDPTNPSLSYPDNTESLVGYWPMNEGKGTEILDKKGSNKGTIKGNPEWTTVNDFPGDRSRSVLEFDNNAANYVQIKNPFKNSKSFTIDLWVKPSIPEKDTDYHGFIGEEGTDNIKSRMPSLWMKRQANKNLTLHGDSYDSDGKRFAFWLEDFYTSSVEEWVHITWVKDGNQYRVYRNGKLFGTAAAPPEVANVGAPKSTYDMGRVEAGVNWYGEIAEVRIWDRALDKYDFWQFLPFRGHTLEDLKEILTNKAEIEAYKEHPFDPHAIARLRIGAYEKAVVMHYIDNLLDWADSLFTQDTWESITQATTLYLLANDLLGPKPENVGQVPTPKPASFADIRKKFPHGIPDFLMDLENYLGNNLLTQFGNNGPFNAIDAYFCVSENKELAKYWERVEDRLFKIRHCQNIEGVERQLALFAPPIDPMQLVRLAAAGDGSLNLPTTDAVPHYRFSHLLERAKSMTSTLIQLGSTLLSTLEKKDAEELAVLRATQEPLLLQLITKTKEKQIEEAEANLAALQQSLTSAQGRDQHYQDLIAAGWNAGEKGSVALMGTALDLQVAASITRAASAVGYLMPCIFGFSDGGMKFGDAIEMGAKAFDDIAGKLSQGASIASTVAQFQRREGEWQFQQQMAEWDGEQITKQIEAAKVRIELAKAELEVHQKSVEQSQEILDFLKHKFTNKELYQWMVSRLSGLYFQAYKIALNMAYAAQKAFQYELTKDDTYIEPIHWDSNKKGLLAGESLMLELNQLEKAYLDGNDRRLEVEKTISLLQLNPQALSDLKTKGKCKFSFDEKLFDYGFPSHYCRQIKTISISIPAVVGPYQNINATLTQTSNKVLIKPNKDAVKWLLNGASGDPPQGTMRLDWRKNQEIAISKGVNDSGMFVLNFQDERYLPFEGTGAISDWELAMPKATNRFDFESITDVIITLSYTALEGGSTIYDAVTENLKNFAGKRLFSLAQQFSGPWYQFMHPGSSATEQTLSFQLLANMFPMNLTNYTVKQIYIQMVLAESVKPSGFNSSMKVKMEKGGSSLLDDTINLQEQDGIVSGSLPKEVSVSDFFDSSWSLSMDKGSAGPLRDKNGFLDPNQVTNIALVVTYEADIDWQ